MKVYMIYGSSGQYDDHSQWVEAIFVIKEKAEEFLKRKNRQVKIFKFMANTIQEAWGKDNGRYETYSSKSVNWSWEYKDHYGFTLEEKETKD